MFAGRRLLIASKHQKELVMSPVLEKSLGVSCFVSADFDTDEFGTFTCEEERTNDPISAARKKCYMRCLQP